MAAFSYYIGVTKSGVAAHKLCEKTSPTELNVAQIQKNIKIITAYIFIWTVAKWLTLFLLSKETEGYILVPANYNFMGLRPIVVGKIPVTPATHDGYRWQVKSREWDI